MNTSPSRLAALGLISLVAFACGSSSPAPRACATDSECDTGQSCIQAVCATFDAGPAQSLGGPCYESLQCASGLVCALDGTGLAGGLCTEVCTPGSCPANTICADLRATPVNQQLCLPMPISGACRAGYSACADFSGACVPAALCPASGLSATASPDLGQACTAGSCAVGETCRFGLDFPFGACTLACSVGDATSCPSNGACVATDQGPLCLATCAAGACRGGYACSGTPAVCKSALPGPRACPTGTATRIISGGTAGPATAPAFCIEPVATSAFPAAMVQEFGAHKVGDVVQFQVPDQAASFSIVSQALRARGTLDYNGNPLDNTVVPTNVTAPGNNVIYNDSAALPSDLSTAPLYFATDSPATSMMTMPDTTAGLALADGGLPAGTWTFQVNDYATECLNTSNCDGGASDDLYDVSVVIKPGPAQTSGVLDIAFYLVGAAGLTSATAPTNQHVLRMLGTLETIYAEAGICVGTVTFYDVPAWAQTLFATGLNADKTSPCDELNQMFTLARAGNTLNFFLVEDISSSNSGGTVVGIDGAIPGPSSLGGTVHSGAAVSAADLAAGTCSGSGIDLAHCGADVVGYIAAHEGGHWMGLYHTTEATGATFDPLSDTPTCVCQSCTSGSRQAACGNSSTSTFVEATDCEAATGTCGGAGDLMFWLLDQSISKGTLSGQQAEVMRRNPLVQ